MLCLVRNRLIASIIVVALICNTFALPTFALVSSTNKNFQDGCKLLKEGTYTTIFWGKGARDYFQAAYLEDHSLGPMIADELLQYADSQGAQGVLLLEIYADALAFDNNIGNDLASSLSNTLVILAEENAEMAVSFISNIQEPFASLKLERKSIFASLLNQAERLASEGYFDILLFFDAVEILTPLLTFYPPGKPEIEKFIWKHASNYVQKSDFIDAENAFGYYVLISDENAKGKSREFLIEYAKKSIDEKRTQDAFTALNILLTKVDASNDARMEITNILFSKSENYLVENTPRYSVECMEVASKLWPGDQNINDKVTRLICEYSDMKIQERNFRLAILALDEYRYKFQEQFAASPTISDTYKDVFDSVISQDNITKEEAYQNFQVILSLRCFKDRDFVFKKELDDLKDIYKDTFKDIRLSNEQLLFFFDTSRLFTGSRGIALSNEALFYANLTGNSKRISFNDINSMELRFTELRFSTVGWGLLINGDTDLEFTISKLSDEEVIPFLSALVYFVNSHKNSNAPIALNVPEKEQKILQEGFFSYERYKDTIKVAGTIVVIAGSILLLNNLLNEDTDIQDIANVANLQEIGADNVAAMSGGELTNLLTEALTTIPREELQDFFTEEALELPVEELAALCAEEIASMPDQQLAELAMDNFDETLVNKDTQRNDSALQNEEKVPAGYSAILRQLLGSPPTTEKNAWAAHHIIPAQFFKHPILVKAGIDILYMKENGIWLPRHQGLDPTLPLHKSNHPIYNTAIKRELDKIPGDANSATIEQNVMNIIKVFGEGLRQGKPLHGEGVQW